MIVAFAHESSTGLDGAASVLLAVLAMVVVHLLKKRLSRWIDNRVIDVLYHRRTQIWRFVVNDIFLWRSERRGDRRHGLAQRLSERFRVRLRRVPGISESSLAVFSPADNQEREMGVRLVVVIALNLWWSAYTAARHKDHTLQIGMWVRPSGVATIALGYQGFRHGQSWAVYNLAVGVALCLVGHYLGALRPPRPFVMALPVLGPLLVALAIRIQAPGPEGLARTATETSILIGAVMATVAGIVLFIDVASMELQQVDQKDRLLERRRLKGIAAGMRFCRLACWSFGAANVLQAVTFAPTNVMKATHITIALLLSLTASETFKKPNRYRRLYKGW